MVKPVTSPAPSLVIAAGAVWPVVCAVLVLLRFHARRYQLSSRALDDWLTIPALILLWGQGAALIAGVALRSLAYPTPLPPPGVDIETYSSFQSRTNRQLFWAILLMQIPALTFIKLSFVFFYRRIFVKRTSGRALDIVSQIVIVVLILWAIAFFLSELFLCKTTFEDIWLSKSSVEENATCLQLLTWDKVFTATDFVLDLVILVMPIRPILRLELSREQKFTLVGIFTLGGLTVAASIVRMVVFVQEIQEDASELTDVDLIITACLYWSIMESGLALSAACLPSIYGLFNTARQRSRESKTYVNVDSDRSHSFWSLKKARSNNSARRKDSNTRDIYVTNDVEVNAEQVYRLNSYPSAQGDLPSVINKIDAVHPRHERGL